MHRGIYLVLMMVQPGLTNLRINASILVGSVCMPMKVSCTQYMLYYKEMNIGYLGGEQYTEVRGAEVEVRYVCN